MFIDLVPELLCTAIEHTISDLQKSLLQTMDEINFMTTGLDNSFTLCESDDEVCLKCCVLDKVLEYEVEYVKDLLVVSRQYEIYIR